MCLFSIGGHIVGPTVLKFGMEDHVYPWEVIWYILFCPLGRGRPKSGSGGPCSPNSAFLWKFHKTKFEGHPSPPKWGKGQVRSGPRPHQRCLAAGPSSWEASAAMVPWPFRLKFGREIGTYPGRSVTLFGLGTPNPRVRCPKNGARRYNLPKLWVLCSSLDNVAGWSFAAGSGFEAGWGSVEGWGSATGPSAWGLL